MKYLVILILFFTNLSSSIDLTRQIPIEKTVFLKGKIGLNHFYEPSELIFYTGKLYKLIIKNVSDSKHYFGSDLFSKSIFTRKIQVSKNTNKVAEIKGIINEVEVWPNEALEWWFVPLKTGVFLDLICNVKDKKTQLSHSEMGMKGKIIIK
ncbi:biphenyl 2,3-dioxygenase [Alphaproteobacteria bacterium]|nr:biphenyl 2,3-dioxygenase [Alphaproteobacteria bacterium]